MWGTGDRRRTYELDEDVYIDVFEGSRQFDPLWRFHPPIAATARANRPALSSLLPTMSGERAKWQRTSSAVDGSADASGRLPEPAPVA